jgi:hypothetical protein
MYKLLPLSSVSLSRQTFQRIKKSRLYPVLHWCDTVMTFKKQREPKAPVGGFFFCFLNALFIQNKFCTYKNKNIKHSTAKVIIFTSHTLYYYINTSVGKCTNIIFLFFGKCSLIHLIDIFFTRSNIYIFVYSKSLK